YPNRQPQHQSIKPQLQPQSPSRRPVMPQYQSTSTFGPTSTKPPLHGGFVPITMDSTSNRPPVTQESGSQNVWFPKGNHSQTQFVQGARLNKPIKPVKKQPNDIYRIITT